MTAKTELFRLLPSVDELLRDEHVAALEARYGHASLVEAARTVLDQLRAQIASGALDEAALEATLKGAAAHVQQAAGQAAAFSLRRVINATGVVIHTNLGRAPMVPEAVARIAEVATGYSTLEFDLEKGERGRRDVHAQRLFAQLFARHGAAESSTVVVNNNAAAVLLALSALAEGGEVIVSRGELVEIGGSFRIPDIMSRSGAVLREVGTTNRTRAGDYEKAINERTRLLLRVHRSNFEIVGFTEQPELAELVALGKKKGIPVMEDLGSGALVELKDYGIADEPNVYDSLRAGVALVTYSGDKLLGGPQAGLATGDPKLVAKLRSHPLFRALRVDKMSYAALEATLETYLREDHDALPLLHMLGLKPEAVRARCEQMKKKLEDAPKLALEVVEARSVIGGGAAPGKTLPSFALSVRVEGVSASALAHNLRSQMLPVVTRVEDDRVLLDLRTVFEQDDAKVEAALRALA